MKYPEIEVIKFDNKDIIATSGGLSDGGKGSGETGNDDYFN